MVIRSSGAYNNPEMAQAAQNIAAMFGPPSASDLAGYSTARKNNQDVEHKARLAQIAQDPNASWADIDRAGLGYGGWVPTQSFERVDRDNVTSMANNAADNQTLNTNNIRDNQTKILTNLYGTADPYSTSPGMPAELAGTIGLPELPARFAPPKPLSETEWTAQQAQRMVDAGKITDDDLIGMITSGSDSSAVEKIKRVAANLISTGTVTDPKIANDLATGIVDGRLRESRDPITNAVQIVDMATGLPAQLPSAAPPPNSVPTVDDQMMGAITDEDPFGLPYPDASGSFGVGGALAGTINRTLDAVGIGAPYGDVQTTQASFGVLRENLLNDLADAYNRQPPSWLLEEIRNLTPNAGSVFEGPEAAQAKLNAIGRQLQSQIAQTQESLGRANSPTNQQELQTRLGSLQTGLARVQEALAAFGPQGGGQAPDADGWVTLPNGVRIREVQ